MNIQNLIFNLYNRPLFSPPLILTADVNLMWIINLLKSYTLIKYCNNLRFIILLNNYNETHNIASVEMSPSFHLILHIIYSKHTFMLNQNYEISVAHIFYVVKVWISFGCRQSFENTFVWKCKCTFNLLNVGLDLILWKNELRTQLSFISNI